MLPAPSSRHLVWLSFCAAAFVVALLLSSATLQVVLEILIVVLYTVYLD